MLELNNIIGFFVNLIAILIFTGAIYYRRHKRRDLFVTFTFFNIAMFFIVTLISHTQLGLGASFGLFALLGLIRLRSEEFSNYEVGYFFGCLTLAIVNGLANEHFLLLAALNAIILLSIALLDHPKLLRNTQHSRISLDAVYENDDDMVAALEKLLGAKILSHSVTRIDSVRDTTEVNVNYQKHQ